MAEPKMLAKGKWQLRTRYRDPITNEWREKKFTGSTKKEVNEANVAFLANVNQGRVVKDIRLLDFFDTWVSTYKEGNVSLGRMEKIALVRKNLEEFFGKKQTLKGVDKIKYQKWINWLAKPGGATEKGLSKETVSNRHNIAKSMFLEAMDMTYISMNPTRKATIKGNKPEHKSARTVSHGDLVQFTKTLLQREDTTSKFLVLVHIYVGPRYGEVAALTWDDLHPESETISINKSFKYDGGLKRFGPPKSEAGVRDVDAPAILFSQLRMHKRAQAQEMISGKLKNPRNLIFVNTKDGWPISNTAVNKYIKETCNLAGVPRISTHSFRHAKIDSMILAEADPVYMISQIGHKSVSQSYEYASNTQENREKNKGKVMDTIKDII